MTTNNKKVKAYLGLGSNVGDRFENLLEAVKQLNSKPDITVRKVSHIYETDPVLFHCVAPAASVRQHGEPQRDYFNAALEVETVLDAKELVGVCLGIEQNMGRVRPVRRTRTPFRRTCTMEGGMEGGSERWGPRIIDIDLLLYGDSYQLSAVSCQLSDVTVPHPLMHTRGFVLYPLSDIAPDMVHPVSGLTINQLKAEIGHEGIRKMNNMKLVV